jgi:hypothetical protein
MNFGRRVLASIGFLIAGIVVMLFRDALEWDEAISMAISTALLMLGILGLGTAFGRRDSGDGLIRLDHFMPFARRKRLRPGKPSSIVTLAHRLLPSHLFFDPETGKEGSIRRWLRKIGPGTLSSPWRRLIQAFTFTLFTVLFFYVCWPYSAKPIEITQPIGSLQFKQIDQASGDLLFETSVPNNIDWATQDTWHLELPSSDASKLPSSLPVHVIPTQASNLRLVPIDPLPADQLDQILLVTAPYPSMIIHVPSGLHITPTISTEKRDSQQRFS